MKCLFGLISLDWKKRIAFDCRHFCLLAYALFLLLLSLFLATPQWDEYLDFAGCVGAFNHLLASLRGNPTDISTITSDLEWYGNAFRWPAYLLWVLQSGFPVLIHGGPQTYDVFLLSGFSSSIHIIAVSYAVIGVYIYSRLVARLGLSRLIGLASISCFALSPFWLANATWNLKDLPVAVALLFVEYLSLSPLNSHRSNLVRERRRFWIVSGIFGLILATKYAYIPLVMLLSFLYIVSRRIWFLLEQCAPLPFARMWNRAFSIKSLYCVVRDLSFQVVAAIILSFFLTPQILGNPLYPLKAFDYFLRHPVVSIDRGQAISFFLSRLSYLLTPLVLVLVFVSCFGFYTFSRIVLSPASHSSKSAYVKRAIVSAFCLVPLLFAVVPVLISGRTFYGPDLRHVIWIYPPVILFISIFAEDSLRFSTPSLRIVTRFAILLATLITLLEVLLISPHFYSYQGVFPFRRGDNVNDLGLILSRYSPGLTPELHKEMLTLCADDEECSSVLLGLKGSSGKYAAAHFSFPINPSYYQSYLRLGARAKAASLYPALGYKLSVETSPGCKLIQYGREWPVKLFSSVEACRSDGGQLFE